MTITIHLTEYAALTAEKGYKARYEAAIAAIKNALDNGGGWAISGVLCECGQSCMANDWRGMYLFDPQDVSELRELAEAADLTPTTNGER